MLPRVTVKKGLSFACPRCQQFGYRAAERSDVFTPPPGHSIHNHSRFDIVVCHAKRNLPWIFRLVFADNE